jgi:hypothetical protein
MHTSTTQLHCEWTAVFSGSSAATKGPFHRSKEEAVLTGSSIRSAIQPEVPSLGR